MELELKPRSIRGENVLWHDAYVLQVAIENIATGKPFSKIALWLSIAGKVQYELENDEDFCKQTVPNKSVIVQLRKVEARKLWNELCKLKPEQFARNIRTGEPASPNPGTLYLMLSDVAEQLGYEVPTDDDED